MEGIPTSEREALAAKLHAGLGQTLVGIAMLAKCHANAMEDRRDPEARRARQLKKLLSGTVADVDKLIHWLDHGKAR